MSLIKKKCESCGKTVSIREYRAKTFRFCSYRCHGHTIFSNPELQRKIQRKYGSDNFKWKGGIRKHSNGYRYILIRNKASRKGTYVLEHRYVMEKLLGRKLLHTEQVHHINHNKLDNRPENLIMIDRAEHTRLHQQEKRVVKKI